MKRPLYIVGGGGVTPAGLDRRQTLAAIRASLSAFEEIALSDPFGTTQVVARIPSHWRLHPSEGGWFVNMAVRAIDEAMRDSSVPAEATALLITTAEQFRTHLAFDDIPLADFLGAVLKRSGRSFHPSSRLFHGGAAASVGMIERALALFEQAGVAEVLLGGVDGFVNERDLARIGAAGRLRGPGNAQGLVPGEGAAFVRLSRTPPQGARTAAAIHGVGMAEEADTVLGERHSQGRAMLAALRGAVGGDGPREPDIAFVVSNGNGERYAGLETMIARARFYQTHREMLPTAYPAMTVGETGAASGALALMLAADSLVGGYAPGPAAMCEVASEGGLRAAAVVSRASLR